MIRSNILKCLKVLPFDNLIKVLMEMTDKEFKNVFYDCEFSDWHTSRVYIAVSLCMGRDQNMVYNWLVKRRRYASLNRIVGVNSLKLSHEKRFGGVAVKMYRNNFNRYYRKLWKIL